MPLRAKTLRRLATVAALCTVVLATAFFFYQRNARLRRDKLAQDGHDGIAAFHAGDFITAQSKLGRVIRQVPAYDRDINFAYAVSRSKVESPDGSHIIDAVVKLKEILTRDPSDGQAAHALLALYRKTDGTDDMLALADRLLGVNENDTDALQAKAIGLVRHYHYDEALKINLRYNALVPNDLNSQVLTLTLFSRAKKLPTDIVAHAQNLKAAHPDDPRFELLLAVAFQAAGDGDAALAHLRAAAAHPIPDVVFIRHLTACFDQLKQFATSRKLLETAVETTDDLPLRRLLAQRLWQQGENADILARFGKLDFADPASDAHLLAYRALALYQSGQPEMARGVVAALRGRSKDRAARAWAAGIDARFELSTAPRTKIIAGLTAARELDSDNAVFAAWLGDAYYELGEYAAAVRCWSTASDQLPGWVAPLVGKSAALLALGRTADAVLTAESAYRLLPDLSSAANLALVRYRQLEENPDDARAAELLDLVNRVDHQSRGEPRTLPIRVALLARSGRRDEAAAAVRLALAQPARYDPATLLRLAAVSREEGLGLETAVLAAPVARTPEWTLTQAARLADDGDVAGGFALFEAAKRDAPSDDVTWDSALARYASAVNDESSLARWRALSDKNPDNLEVQQALLAAVPPTRDGALVDVAIDRLKAVTGDTGQQWQLARARWLLAGVRAGTAAREADAREAVMLLTNVVREAPGQTQPRLLLASALDQTGQGVSAMQHLRSVLAIDPRNAAAAIELVRVLNDAGKQEEAKDVLRKLSTDALVSGRQRLLLAAALIDAGDRGRAVELLDHARQRHALEPAGLQLLAETLAGLGRTDAAAAAYAELTDARNLRPGALASAAEFFASAGDPAQARLMLDRLASMKLPTGQFDIAAGRFEERFGEHAKAAAHFQAAAYSNTAAGHVALIEFFLRASDFPAARAAAARAVEALPKDVALKNLRLETEALAHAKANPSDLAPLIDALAADPARAAEVETLRAVRDAKASGATDTERVVRLRAVADRFPRFLPLQEQVVLGYLAARQPDEAADLARRVMNALPNDPAAARLAFTAARAARRWPSALAAAAAWRERQPGDAFAPDCALAEAQLETGDPAAARKRIQLYLDALPVATHAGDVTPHDIARRELFARILAATNEVNRAADVLSPALNAPAGRSAFLRIARDTLRDPEVVAAWLERVSAGMPPAPSEERTAAALAWSDAGARLDAPALLGRSADLLSAESSANPAVLFRLAQVNERLDRLPEAEAALRAVLKADPNHAEAANDLAYVLLMRGGHADEAGELATRAVTANPTEARFFDTLARVRLAAGDKPGAKAAFEKALKLEPNQIDALVGYAGLLGETNDRATAGKLLDRADAVLTLDPDAARRFRVRIGDLRQTLSRTE